MALTCPVELDVATLRREIQTMYGRVANAPDSEFHCHRGPVYAASRLGYDQAELAQLPLAFIDALADVPPKPADMEQILTFNRGHHDVKATA